jgi:hypothetical protein
MDTTYRGCAFRNAAAGETVYNARAAQGTMLAGKSLPRASWPGAGHPCLCCTAGVNELEMLCRQ